MSGDAWRYEHPKQAEFLRILRGGDSFDAAVDLMDADPQKLLGWLRRWVDDEDDFKWLTQRTPRLLLTMADVKAEQARACRALRNAPLA